MRPERQFLFTLALALGRTVRELLMSMDSYELSEWLAYARLNPLGEERADLRTGILASILVNINRDPRKSKPAKPHDFMPKFGLARQPKQQSWQEIMETMKILTDIQAQKVN